MARRGENIHKRKDGRWEGRYIKARTPDRRICWGYIYGTTYAEVKQRLIHKKSEYGGFQLTDAHLTFTELAEAWLQSVKCGLKESTCAHYQYTLYKYVLPILGTVPISRLEENILEQALQKIIAPPDIVINSLRKLDVPQQPFMERPIDSKAGYKHHVTNEYLKHLQKSLMDLCNREFLYQVDLLSPSRTGVTEAEYWAQRRLDEKKQEIEKEGFTPNLTKFQTQKQLIRDAVAAAREKAISYEDFQDILQDEYNIFVKTQRGRYSYLLPERNKFISERSLGDSCKRECLEGFFVQNAEKNLRYKEDPILIFTTRTRLRLVVDLQENVKAQENLAYALKVKISNLQKMAETLVWVQENNINDLTELNDLCKTAQANAQAAYERLSQAEDELYKTNEQIHYAGQYLSTKEVQQQFTKAIFKKKFRAEHSKELDAYVESVKYFREENDGKLPSLKFLKKRKEELTKEIAERKKVYTPLKEESRRLEVASDNVYSIFRKTNEMKSDLAWKREWEARVREKARQEQVRQEQRVRQPKRKKRSYDVSL